MNIILWPFDERKHQMLKGKRGRAWLLLLGLCAEGCHQVQGGVLSIHAVAHEPRTRLAIRGLLHPKRVAVVLVQRDHPPAQGQPQHDSALVVGGKGKENEAAAARAHAHVTRGTKFNAHRVTCRLADLGCQDLVS